GDARGKTVALLGLTFKPNTDDMRDAPSLAIVQALEDAGAKVVAYDPEGAEVAAPLMPKVVMAKDAYEAADGADALVLVTEWDIFRALDLKRIADSMNGKALVDLRNIYPVDEAQAAGFSISRVGGKAD
ncbi:UDP binding domain-containing protein, partial [Sphingobium sp. Leaf26]